MTLGYTASKHVLKLTDNERFKPLTSSYLNSLCYSHYCMHKAQKKIDNNVRKALTQACDSALEHITGFKWLTHFAQWDNFPASLRVVCVFETHAAMETAVSREQDLQLRSIIQSNLLKVGINIKIKDIRRTLILDNEEACEQQDAGNWKQRINNCQARLIH